MAIITFTSDFGNRDHYVAAVKAKIFNYNPNIQVIDISHHIDHYNIAQGSFVLNSVFRDFPRGTVHLVAINSLSDASDRYVAIRLEDHFFVGTDNGIFTLLSDKPAVIVELNYDKGSNQTFPEKNIFAFAAVSLASGKAIYDLGNAMLQGSLKKMVDRKLKVTKNTIEGNVIHIDSYGNAITNISKKAVEEGRLDRQVTVAFGREEFAHVNNNYHQAESGDCVIVFNDNNFLEIAIKNGNASELMSLHYDSPVRVAFYPEMP